MANPKITSTGFVGDLIGTASVAKSIVLEPITGYGTTIAGFQSALKAKVLSGSVGVSTHYRFAAAVAGFVSNWNAGNTTHRIEDGTYNELIPLSPTTAASNGYAAFLFTTYLKENQYLMILKGGEWQKLEKIPSQADLTEIKAQISSASANYALKSHKHVSADINDLSSSIDSRLSVNVTASNPTLSFGSTSTVGTIAGKKLNVTMPESSTLSVKLTAVDDSGNYSCSIGVDGLFNALKSSGKVVNITVVSGSVTICRATPVVGAVEYGDTAMIALIQGTDMTSAFSHLWNFAQVVVVEGGESVQVEGFNGSSCVLPTQADLRKISTLDRNQMETDSKLSSVSSSLSDHLEYDSRSVRTYSSNDYVVTLIPGETAILNSLKDSIVVKIDDTSLSENVKCLKEAVFRFKTGTTVPSITWPSGVYWANGEAPTIEANTYYECNFGYVVDKWCVAYQSFKEATA